MAILAVVRLQSERVRVGVSVADHENNGFNRKNMTRKNPLPVQSVDENNQDPMEIDESYDASGLKRYRRVLLLTDGFSTPFLAKTAISMLRYRGGDVVGVLESSAAGQTAEDLFGLCPQVPVVASLDEVDADALFIGIAPPGGKLPEAWYPIIGEALRRRIDVVSGLHDFLSSNVELTKIAADHDCKLIDVRKNSFHQTASGDDFRPGCLRIHTVGQDCSLGKMVTAMETRNALSDRGLDAAFVATGQTGIMISGDGIPIDCVVADFVNGAAESLIRRNQHHDILLVEGQGSLSHPSFSAVTLGLLHGCAPDGLIFCYEVGRTMVKGLDEVPLVPIETLIDCYERVASLRHPCRVIGIAMNSRNVSEEEASEERERVTRELGLPTCDVFRDGPDVLADAIVDLQRELNR